MLRDALSHECGTRSNAARRARRPPLLEPFVPVVARMRLSIRDPQTRNACDSAVMFGYSRQTRWPPLQAIYGDDVATPFLLDRSGVECFHTNA